MWSFSFLFKESNLFWAQNLFPLSFYLHTSWVYRITSNALHWNISTPNCSSLLPVVPTKQYSWFAVKTNTYTPTCVNIYRIHNCRTNFVGVFRVDRNKFQPECCFLTYVEYQVSVYTCTLSERAACRMCTRGIRPVFVTSCNEIMWLINTKSISPKWTVFAVLSV